MYHTLDGKAVSEDIVNGYSFSDDCEKMVDFFELSKEEFLMSYSYLNEADYDITMENLFYEGTEACPECGMEIDYKINPLKQVEVDCHHCGYNGALLCSLCDQPFGCNGGNNHDFCRKSILKTLSDDFRRDEYGTET